MFGSLNGTQLLLSVMILLLGVTLVIIGIQLFFVLKDLRKNLDKTQRILTDIELISGKAVKEQQYLDEVLSSMRTMFGSVSTATTSVSAMTHKLLGPSSVGLTLLQAVNTVIQRRKERETPHE